MIDTNGSWTWAFRTATSRAARSDEASPTAPDRARTTHVAGASRILSNSELLLLRFPILFIYPEECVRRYTTIDQHTSKPWRTLARLGLLAKRKGRDFRDR